MKKLIKILTYIVVALVVITFATILPKEPMFYIAELFIYLFLARYISDYYCVVTQENSRDNDDTLDISEEIMEFSELGYNLEGKVNGCITLYNKELDKHLFIDPLKGMAHSEKEITKEETSILEKLFEKINK
jgi:hypothetical protein